MRRAVALIVAIGLVVGAVFVRRAIDDDDDAAAGPSDPSSPPTGLILCASDLGDVCANVEGATTEPPAVTVDRLVNGEPLGADAWIVAQPWPSIALERAARQGRSLALTVPSTPLARTPLAVFARPTVTGVLDQCGTAVDWKCLSQSVATVRVDFEDPAASTAGLLAVIQQASAFFGSTDFGSNDFAVFESQLKQLKSARPPAPSGQTVFERFVFLHADVLVGLSAVGEQQVQRTQFKGRLVLRDVIQPPISADVVVVGSDGVPAKTTEAARAALSKDGWSTNNLPPTTVLPTADVIIALQDLWKGLR